MQELQIIKEYVEKNVFPLIELNKANTKDIFIYGSKLSSFSRIDSDYDMTFLVESNQLQYINSEMHGEIQNYRVELKIIDAHTLLNQITDGPLAKALAFSESKSLITKDFKFKSAAQIRLIEETNNLKYDIKNSSIYEVENILRHHLKDLRSFFKAKRIQKNSLLIQARLMEMIIDYTSEGLKLWMNTNDEYSFDNLKLALFLETLRPARFFDLEKYQENTFIKKWVNELNTRELTPQNVFNTIQKVHKYFFNSDLLTVTKSHNLIINHRK